MNNSMHMHLTLQMKWTHSLKTTKLTQDEIDNLNISITIKDIDWKESPLPNVLAYILYYSICITFSKRQKNYSDKEKMSGCQGLVRDEGRVENMTTKQ